MTIVRISVVLNKLINIQKLIKILHLLQFTDTNFCIDPSHRGHLTLAPLLGLLASISLFCGVFGFFGCDQKDVSGSVFAALVYEIVDVQVYGCATLLGIFIFSV